MFKRGNRLSVNEFASYEYVNCDILSKLFNVNSGISLPYLKNNDDSLYLNHLKFVSSFSKYLHSYSLIQDSGHIRIVVYSSGIK